MRYYLCYRYVFVAIKFHFWDTNV